MFGLGKYEGKNNEGNKFEALLDQMIAKLKLNGLYDALTLEGVSDSIRELTSICEEVESHGLESLAEKYGVLIPEELLSEENVYEANYFATTMYLSLVALFERIYILKLQEK